MLQMLPAHRDVTPQKRASRGRQPLRVDVLGSQRPWRSHWSGGAREPMLGFAWLAMRQAQEAIRNGRLEDAQRLLSQPAAQGHRKQASLLAHLVRAYAERGERQLRMDDAEAAWRDLLLAEAVQTGDPSAERLRQALHRLALAELRALVQAGELARAEQNIARQRSRGVNSPELAVVDEAVKGWLLAREQADRGEFIPALDGFDRVRRLLPAPLTVLNQFRADLEQRQRTVADLLVRLHEVSVQTRWPEVIDLAEQVLAAAPQHAEARRLRALAWRAVEPATLPVHTQAQPPLVNQAVGDGGPAPRYLLWIDGVGGYLICLGNRLTLGQALPGSQVDVPLIADVGRMHATLTRDVEGYMLEALRSVQVNGKPITRVLLQPEDRVTLGSSFQMVFRQTAPVSLSARLDVVSGHRLPLALDAVLLMADTLVFANSSQAHVTIPALKEPLVLFRNKDLLGIRYSGALTINGQPSTGRCVLDPNTRVVAGDLAFSLETPGPRLG
jgi:tetratricopeptide (TPR) repeat protein